MGSTKGCNCNPCYVLVTTTTIVSLEFATHMLSVIVFLTVTLLAAGISLFIVLTLLKKQALFESAREEACRQLEQELALRCLATPTCGRPTMVFSSAARWPVSAQSAPTS